MRFLMPCLATSVVLMACSQPAPTPAAAPSQQPARATAPTLVANRGKVIGEVKVPINVILGAGASLVSDRGAGLIGNHAAGGFSILAATGQAPAKRLQGLETQAVKGVRVFVADAAGRPIPDIPESQTDDSSQFQLNRVPLDETFVIIAEIPTTGGKRAQLRTVVQVGKYGATTLLDAASTMVSFNVLEGLPGGALGQFNPVKFENAVQATDRNLTPEILPDFTDNLAIKARMDELADAITELRDLLSDIRRELAELKTAVEALKPGAKTPEPTASEANLAAPTPLPGTPTPTVTADAPPAPVPQPSAAPSMVPSAPPSIAPEVEDTAQPSSPTLPVGDEAPAGCTGVSERRCQVMPGFPWTTLGVRVLGQKTVFSQGDVVNGFVQLSIPEGCPLEFVYQPPIGNGSWMVFFGLPPVRPGTGDIRLY